MKWFCLFAVLFCRLASAAETLMVCGGAEIALIDPADDGARRLWSWKAADHPEIPEALRKAFGTTTDMRLLEGGKRLAISSSGGGCALLDYATGRVLWSARVGNAHAIEPLPGGRLIVAGSLGADKLVLFHPDSGDRILWQTPLHSAHGVVWDDVRKRLYALGHDDLREFSLVDWETPTPSLKLESTTKLPDPDGHDLSAVPGSADLVFSTHAGVWRFDRESREVGPFEALKDQSLVKCVSIHPGTGRIAFIQAKGGKAWWSDEVGFLKPEGRRAIPGVTLYKVRWIAAP
jgi:hypothetical protein